MKFLAELAVYIEQMSGVNRDKMEAFADTAELIPVAIDLGEGYEIGRVKYDAVISVERFPARLASTLMASLLIWLDEHDPDRDKKELNDPEIDISLENSREVFIQITVPFDEGIQIVPDPDGDILFMGKQYSVATVPVNVAEKLDSVEVSCER